MDHYRLYIDESGTHDYSERDTVKHRYLGILGVMIKVEEYESRVQPGIIGLRKIFSEDPDDLVVLHRDEIVNKQGAFSKLENTTVQTTFDTQLLELLGTSE